MISIYNLEDRKKLFWVFSMLRSGEVQIKLRNRGTDAYKHNDYGDQIIIERRFTSDGSSQYKLKAKDGNFLFFCLRHLT